MIGMMMGQKGKNIRAAQSEYTDLYSLVHRSVLSRRACALHGVCARVTFLCGLFARIDIEGVMKIDVDNHGLVKIVGNDQAALARAREMLDVQKKKVSVPGGVVGGLIGKGGEEIRKIQVGPAVPVLRFDRGMPVQRPLANFASVSCAAHAIQRRANGLRCVSRRRRGCSRSTS